MFFHGGVELGRQVVSTMREIGFLAIFPLIAFALAGLLIPITFLALLLAFLKGLENIGEKDT